MIARKRNYRPFARSGRGTIVAIFVTFGLISALSIYLSISATNKSRNRATVVEVVGRQRTLAQSYVKDVLLVRAGEKADPALTASLLKSSAQALLNGGTAPPVNGDDDETKLSPATGAVVTRAVRSGRTARKRSRRVRERSPSASTTRGGAGYRGREHPGEGSSPTPARCSGPCVVASHRV